MSPRAQRGGVKSSLTRIDNFLKSLETAQIDHPDMRKQLKAKLDLLYENKSKLLNIHEEIIAEVGVNVEEEESELERLLSRIDDIDTAIRLLLYKDEPLDKGEKGSTGNESFESTTANKFDTFLEKFSSALDKISSGKPSYHEASDHIKLQPISIPTFSGSYQEWPTFKDIFLTTIGDSKKLPDAHKMQYLISSLSGEAKETVQHMKICDNNYRAAWSLLSEKYDDQCALINDNIQRFLSQPNIKASSEASVRQFRTTCNSILHSLDSLNANGRDIWLVHWASKHLDSESMSLWAREIKNKLPTWDLFDKFLDERAKTLAIYTPPVEKSTSQKSQAPQKSNTRPKQNATNLINTDKADPCACCKGDSHKLFKCSKFVSLTPVERYDFVKLHKLCRNCLGKNHGSKDCKSSTCKKCNTKHSTLLHDAFPASTPPENQQNTPPAPQVPNNTPNQTVAISSSVLSSHTGTRVFLATAVVEILDKENKVHLCRAILDSGAQLNLITQELSQKLKLDKFAAPIVIKGVTGSQSVAKYQVETVVRSRATDFHVDLRCLIVPKITGELPNWTVDTQSIPIPKNIFMADPNWDVTRPIDLLIGAEVYGDIVKDESIKLGSGLPQLKNTDFGWSLIGPHKAQSPSTVGLLHSSNPFECCLTTFSSIDASLQKFWKVEEVSVKPPLTQEHNEVEEHFSKTTYRDPNGRYVLQLPLRPTVENLEDNKENALRQFRRLEKRLNAHPQLKEEYTKSIHQYLKDGFLEPVPKQDVSEFVYYMPHHPVIKESSSTTKVRIVHNASSRSSTGLSLNEVLKVGPTVQPPLVATLTNFRKHPVAFSTDIRQMYPQFLLNPIHRDLQRVFWRDSPSEPIVEYRLTGVCFGVASSPFLATRALMQLALDEQKNYPKASQVLLNNVYVDDCLFSCATIEEALEVQRQLIAITQSAGLTLSKWCSNRKELLKVCGDSVSDSVDLPEHTVSTLGMKWNTTKDIFHYEGSFNDSPIKTKRNALSFIARLYDPEGFLGPLIVRGKILVQSLWKLKLTWDDELPPSLLSEWEAYHNDLKGISAITIPRWASTIQSPTSEELHVFCDASQEAYGAALYYVTEGPQGRSSFLLFSKSKVAPIQTLTIPRLELLSAELGLCIMDKFRNVYNVSNCHYWTDSMVVFHQIQSSGLKFEVFVAHRIAKIHSLSNRENWHHVPGSINPADIISRGSTAQDLRSSSLWWHGPSFLLESSANWPQCNISVDEQSALLASSLEEEDQPEDLSFDFIAKLISETTDYAEATRVLAITFRFLAIARKAPHQTGPLSVAEITHAERALVKWDQQNKLSHLFTAIEKGTLHSNQGMKSFRMLAPFIDKDGLIRVGGRTSQSSEAYDTRFPILLPKGELSRMIASHEHRKQLHPGPQLLLATLQQRLWPLGGRKLTRDAVKNCIRCIRFKPRLGEQFMGDLPSARVNFNSPFHNTAVDYCGPVWIRPNLKRGGTPRKAYVCVFVCLTTKAVHLELVNDLTCEAFIAALRRLVGRRSAPLHIYSDNATNFTAANKELQSLLEAEDFQRKLTSEAASMGVTWHFQPPRAPHHGGLCEAGVKSLKHHLVRIVGDRYFTYEEFYTILVQIEGILNSRPLTPLTDDPSELEPLTPGHFLTPGKALTELPNPDLQELPMNRLNRWQLCQHMVQEFSRRWRTEYLTQLQKRTKWFANLPNLKVGDLVIIHTDNSPSHRWPLAVIQEIHPGKDGRVRVVTVRTAKGVYKRSVNKLCRLPTPDNDEIASKTQQDPSDLFPGSM
ncbi:uncharacterized protein LOC129794555 [Lutzomyia longipalpis]|uniref:uncharacterized protein LOC129794555 n=1 Tax=Lutzomyia longipalpis TaxID=7200 RepID=UPI002483A8C1|nr:uncharacterized protein LOC129794555 [Lutzomyia longipalpis]